MGEVATATSSQKGTMNNSSRSLRGRLPASLALACGLAGQMACTESRGNEQILKTFYFSTNEGFNPSGGLVQYVDGTLYGVTRSGGPAYVGAVFKLNPDGTGFNLVHGFGSTTNDVKNPIGPLAVGAAGTLYGVSSGGGANGVGAVFKLTGDGNDYKVLYSFDLVPDFTTPQPQAPLVQGVDGVLYGTTRFGGAKGGGTVYRLNPDGTGFDVLHNFGGYGTNDGNRPQAPLIIGADGALYGTTYFGGTNRLSVNTGSVFKLHSDGTGFELLHSFPENANDGSRPQGALIQGSDGVLYGTTSQGGAADGGTVFRLNPNGTGYLVLHSFDVHTANLVAQAALVLGTNGTLYGITTLGGYGSGSVFQLRPDGTGYALLHVFGSFTGDGTGPQVPLLLANDGALYGTTSGGGVGGISANGTVFRMTTSPEPPLAVSIVPLVGGGINLSFDGVVGATYRLDASTNLLDWITLGTVFNESGPVQFLDGNATNAPQTFYRAVWVH
jgi:uncharacterized repeat protein (TIGR03803 family)